MSGTSMAAPGVSGCAALLREALARWKNLPNPSGPLMKALLINGVDTLAKIGPNVQGFGQINMTRTLRHLGKPPTVLTGAAVATTASGYAQGVAKNYDVIAPFKAVVPNPNAPGKKVNFVATLVYYDPPSELTNNKMNLAVTYKGTKSETFPASNNETVLRISLNNVVPAETITIQAETKLISVDNSVIPWGLAWDHFET
jgi:subtilisin family serine protease